MSAMAAARLGYRCHVFTDEPDSPAAQVCASHTLGDYEDRAALRRVRRRRRCGHLRVRERQRRGPRPAREPDAGAPVPRRAAGQPGPRGGEGLPQRGRRRDRPLARGRAASPSCATPPPSLGFPPLLKTTRLGYDGKGQALLRSPADLDAAWEALEPKPLILEGFVDFACEVSAIVARGARRPGQRVRPRREPAPRRHPRPVRSPRPASARRRPGRRRDLAWRVAEALDLVGLLAVEMFVDARRPRARQRDRARGRTTAGTGPSTPARRASSSCTSAPSPGCRCRRPPGTATPP